MAIASKSWKIQLLNFWRKSYFTWSCKLMSYVMWRIIDHTICVIWNDIIRMTSLFNETIMACWSKLPWQWFKWISRIDMYIEVALCWPKLWALVSQEKKIFHLCDKIHFCVIICRNNLRYFNFEPSLKLDGDMLEILMDHKFQWTQEGWNCTSLTCNAVTQPTKP